MIQCLKCKNDLDQPKKNALAASITGSVMGDEYTESYYYCEDCKVYTVKIGHDQMSDDDASFRGPLTKSEGDEDVKLIKHCPTPWDKKCRCDTHTFYFGEWLD
jgi:hypothetical protein